MAQCNGIQLIFWKIKAEIPREKQWSMCTDCIGNVIQYSSNADHNCIIMNSQQPGCWPCLDRRQFPWRGVLPGSGYQSEKAEQAFPCTNIFRFDFFDMESGITRWENLQLTLSCGHDEEQQRQKLQSRQWGWVAGVLDAGESGTDSFFFPSMRRPVISLPHQADRLCADEYVCCWRSGRNLKRL